MSWGHNQAGAGPGGPGGPGFNPMGQNQPVHPGSVMPNPQVTGPMGGQQGHPTMGGQAHPNAGPQAGPGQMGHPQNNHQMTQNPNQMGQQQGGGQGMGQPMGGQPQDIDDPIYQLKKMVPKLKESLHSVMTIRYIHNKQLVDNKKIQFNCPCAEYTGRLYW